MSKFSSFGAEQSYLILPSVWLGSVCVQVAVSLATSCKCLSLRP